MNFARLAASATILTSLAIDLEAAKQATVASEVNLRKGPGTDSEIITLIPKGTMVEVGTCTNGWCQVSWNGQDGYSIATNLGTGGPRPVRRPPAEDQYPPPPPGAAYAPPPDVVYEAPPAYVVGPPVYYGRPYYAPYYAPYWRGGWGGRRRW